MKHTSRCTTRHSVFGLAMGLVMVGTVACSGDDTAPDDTPPPEATAPVEISETAVADAALVENGREIVETQCASCHAMGAADDSPRSDAPPLKTVLANYDPDALADDFREHIHVGHPDMPDFDFGPIGTDAVLAYLISIQVDGQR